MFTAIFSFVIYAADEDALPHKQECGRLSTVAETPEPSLRL